MISMKEKLPKVDLKKLAEMKEQNRRERIEFIKQYADWLKKHPEASQKGQG